MEQCGVLKNVNSYNEREETRTSKNTQYVVSISNVDKIIKWASPLACLHSIPLVFHSHNVFTRSQVPV